MVYFGDFWHHAGIKAGLSCARESIASQILAHGESSMRNLCRSDRLASYNDSGHRRTDLLAVIESEIETNIQNPIQVVHLFDRRSTNDTAMALGRTALPFSLRTGYQGAGGFRRLDGG